MLWNEQLDVATFLGRTVLLADHVVIPDRLLGTVLQRGSSHDLRRSAELQLAHAELLEAGIVLPVAQGVAMAVRGALAIDLTNRDLKTGRLVGWVRDQLILEGPTAREAVFVRAIDDWSKRAEKYWLYGRIEPKSVNFDERTFTAKYLQPYDPEYDYGPWIRQVIDSAVGYYIQRTNERVVAADVFGSEYVTASMFEARLLSRRQDPDGSHIAQSAMWANVPELPDLSSPDLVKILQHEHAVQDLRRQVRTLIATARTPGEMVGAITSLTHDLEAASHRIERIARSDRAWQAIVPAGLGTAGVVIGALSGGLPAIAGGAVSVLAGIAPTLAHASTLDARRRTSG
jgi:hypothetical protein